MPVVVFENRMGVTNWGVLGGAFVVSAIIAVYQLGDLWLGVGIVAGLAVLSLIALLIFFRLVASSYLAKLSLDGDRFEAERLTMFGHGKTFSFAVRDTSDWRWTGERMVGRANANLTFRLGGRRYSLPTSNAKVCNIAAMRAAVAKAAG